jgi:hypothetical protein
LTRGNEQAEPQRQKYRKGVRRCFALTHTVNRNLHSDSIPD